jgi:arginase
MSQVLSSQRGGPRQASAIELIAASSGLGLSRPDGRVPRVDLAPASPARVQSRPGPAARRGAAGARARLRAAARCRDRRAQWARHRRRRARACGPRAGRAAPPRGFALVLGGDCSILLGALLGVRRKGRAGLLFLDGHTDFWPPGASPIGGVAGMDLWFATGRRPDLLWIPGGRRQGCWRTHCGRRWRQSPRPRTGLLR